MFNNLNSDNWIYNSTYHKAKLYGMEPSNIKSEYIDVDIEDVKGVNYIHVKDENNSRNERVHVFISKNPLYLIKYLFLKYLSGNWTEVILYQHDGYNRNFPVKILKLLIDNKDFLANRETNKKIESIFEFVLRPKIKILDQVPLKPVVLSKFAIQQNIREDRSLSPLKKSLLLEQLRLKFESKDIKNECKAKIDKLCDWHDRNQSISFINKDPLCDAYHKEMVRKLLEASCYINSLPKEFEEIQADLTEKFNSKISEEFLRAFNSISTDWERSIKKKKFENCIRNILFYGVADFSSGGQSMKFIDGLKSRWGMVLFTLS